MSEPIPGYVTLAEWNHKNEQACEYRKAMEKACAERDLLQRENDRLREALLELSRTHRLPCRACSTKEMPVYGFLVKRIAEAALNAQPEKEEKL